jgi:hypothetical protein
MEPLELHLEGEPVTLTPAAWHDGGGVWVPLEAFCAAAGAVLKDIDGAGQLAVCDEEDGDVCVLLGADDTRDVAGTAFGRLETFAGPLGLTWSLNGNGTLSVIRQAHGQDTRLGVGHRPPKIQLPDVTTGQLVSADVYHDKPAVFYMWASW